MSDDATLRFGIEGDVDEAQVAREADRFADILARAFEKAGPSIGRTLGREIAKGLRNVDFGTSKIFDPLDKQAKAAADNIGRRFVAGADGIEEEFADVGNAARRGFAVGEDAAERLAKEMEALRRRSLAFRETLERSGASPDLLANVDQALERIVANQVEFNRDIERISNDPNLLKGYRTEFENTRVFVGREVQALQSALRNLAQIQRQEGNRAQEVLSRQFQERLQASRQAYGREIATTQGANAQILAETRLAGQKQIQDERQRSRTRIEIVRFTFNQIRQLERGIAGIFRASGTILSTATGAIGASLNRIGGLFRRSNVDLNDGLRGALIRREQSLSRSFSRQTESVRRETFEQSRIIQRFEAQASTGVAGALSGRSQLGTLFGGGLAFGGGFAAFQGLRNGFDVGGDFVQGLAVLGAQLELTEAQMQGVRELSIELGNDISLPGVSALDAAQAIQILAKQFANLGDTALPAAEAAAKGVLQLARATGVQADEAARIVGAAVNVFQVSADEAVAVADQVTNALTKSAGVAFSDFSDAFTQSAGVVRLFTGDAAASEQVLAEFNAAIAILAKNGLIGSDAGTSLKQFFLQANRGTKDATKVLDQIIESAGVAGSVFFDAAGGARTLGESLDILRRGTADLNNQQLTTALGKLFGSDAARAAAFLIQSTSEEFAGLTEAILKSGSAADIAAAQNVGLRGALDGLQSVIETQQIKTYERYQGVLAGVVTRFAELLNAFFEGKGLLGTLRTALTGVAAALGALLIAKAVGEAFQFMALGLRSLVTPLGAVVVGVAALGAAFTVLREISPEFRAETNILGRQLQGRLADSLERIGDLLARVSRFVRTEVVPVFVEFGNAVVQRIVPALDRAGRFLEDTVVPTLRRAGEIIVDLVVPAFQRFADIVSNEVEPRLRVALEFVRSTAGQIAPLIQPAIEGFSTLSDAIDRAFNQDDTSGLLPALTAVRDGVLASLRNIGDALIEILSPQLTRVVDFIAGQFAPQNLERVVTGIAGIVFRIGETIGSIVSNPRVIAALEGLVAAFVATAGLAVAGFAKGIFDNLPELGNMLVDQFQFVLDEVFKDGINFNSVARLVVGGLAAALGTAAVVTALVRGFRSPVEESMRKSGRTGGQTFLRAFGDTLRTGFTGARNNPFAAGLFGGIGGLERAARSESRKAFEALAQEQNRAADRLRLLGRSTIGAAFTGGLDRATFRLPADALKDLQDQYGRAAVAGAEFRARTAAIFGEIGVIGTGAAQVIARDFSNGFSTIGRGLRGLTGQVAGTMRLMREEFRAAGIGVGQAIGGAIVSGVGAALSGQALGTSDSRLGQGIGLAGIISSALFAGASVGGGAQGVAVGGIVAGIGLITAAISANGKAADEARARVQGWVDALEETSSADRLRTTTDRLVDAVQTLDLSTQNVFRNFDFDQLARDALSGGLEFADVFTQIAENAGVSEPAIRGVLDAMERTGATFDELRLGSSKLRGDTLAHEAFEQLREDLARRRIDLGDFAGAISAVSSTSTDIGRALESLDVSATFNRGANSATRMAGETEQVAASTANLATAQDRYVDGLIRAAGLSPGLSAAAERQLERQAINMENISTAIDSLNQQRTDAINTQIGDLTSQLDGARQAADLALESVLGLVNNPLSDPFQASLDDLLLGVGQVGSQLQEQLAQGVDIGAALTQQTDIGATVRGIVGPFSTAFQSAVAQAITDNPGISPEALRDQFQPVFDQIAAGTIEVPDAEGNLIRVNIPPEAQAILLDTLNSLLENDALEMGLNNVLITNEAIVDMNRQLEEARAQLPVRVTFSAQQIADELAALGLDVPLASIFGFLEQEAAAQAQARARALADQTPQERREQPLPPVVNYNQTINQTIQGGGSPQATADASARSNRAAAVQGVRPILAGFLS